jgi:hypothetical protein
MKIKNILMVCGALFFGTVALTSCSDNDEGYDIDGDAKQPYLHRPSIIEDDNMHCLSYTCR